MRNFQPQAKTLHVGREIAQKHKESLKSNFPTPGLWGKKQKRPNPSKLVQTPPNEFGCIRTHPNKSQRVRTRPKFKINEKIQIPSSAANVRTLQNAAELPNASENGLVLSSNVKRDPRHFMLVRTFQPQAKTLHVRREIAQKHKESLKSNFPTPGY